MNAAHRWWHPSLGVLIWLAFFLALTLSPQRVALISADGDPCWHWQQGNWMLAHGEILRADAFSHTRLDAPLIQMWWLSEVLFAMAGNALGWNGVVLLSAALIATTLSLLFGYIRRETDNNLIALAVTLLAAAAAASHWLARPHLFTHLLTVVFAGELRLFALTPHPNPLPQGERESGLLSPPGERIKVRGPWGYVRLPLLMLLWANLHGAFVTGLVLIGAYLAGTLFELLRPGSPHTPCADNRSTETAPHTECAGYNLSKLTVLFGLCLLASFLNPNGWRLHAHILAYLRSSVLVSFVAEYASPNFHSPAQLGFLVFVLVLVLVLVLLRPRLFPTEILLLSGFGYLALQSVRNVPTFALVAAPILAAHVAEVLNLTLVGPALRAGRSDGTARAQVTARSESGPYQGPFTASQLPACGGWVWVPVTLLLTICVIFPRLPTDLPADRYPIAAVQFLRANRSAVRGEMFNDIIWGGYFLLALPERKVFIDGRIDFYGEQVIADFNVIDDVTPGWEAMAARYNVGWTILPPRHALNAVLALHPGWQEVYRDTVAVIYTRRSP